MSPWLKNTFPLKYNLSSALVCFSTELEIKHSVHRANLKRLSLSISWVWTRFIHASNHLEMLTQIGCSVSQVFLRFSIFWSSSSLNLLMTKISKTFVVVFTQQKRTILSILVNFYLAWFIYLFIYLFIYSIRHDIQWVRYQETKK